MKVMKGIVIGTIISTGALMLYTETTKNGKAMKKKVLKQGRNLLKTMEMM